MWFIASIPLWLMGSILVIGGWDAGLGYRRRPGETSRDLVRQWFLSNLLGTVFLLLAAWVVS